MPICCMEHNCVGHEIYLDKCQYHGSLYHLSNMSVSKLHLSSIMSLETAQQFFGKLMTLLMLLKICP